MQTFLPRFIAFFVFIMTLFLLVMFLSGCGTPLAGIDSSVPATRVSTDIPEFTPVADTVADAPRATLPPLQPTTQLPTDALGTFDTTKPSTIDISGRYYWKESCGPTHCKITLWPDKASVWVNREVIGETGPVSTPVIVPTAWECKENQYGSNCGAPGTVNEPQPLVTVAPQAPADTNTMTMATVWAQNTEVAIQRTADAANMYATATAQVVKK